jgi:hypothetical protein
LAVIMIRATLNDQIGVAGTVAARKLRFKNVMIKSNYL